jgi:hypothetical protein
VFEPRELVLHLAIGAPSTSDDELTRIELKPLFESGAKPQAGRRAKVSAAAP